MQGKIKNFRPFIYRRSPCNAITSDLQVKMPHTHTLTHYKGTLCFYKKEISKCLILHQVNKKQSNPTFFFRILSFVQFLELSPVFSGSQDFSFDVFIIF